MKKFPYMLVVAVFALAFIYGCTQQPLGSNVQNGICNGTLVNGTCISNATPRMTIPADGVANQQQAGGIFSTDPEPYVTYEEIQEDDFSGFIARPREEGEYPGIVIIHEWWGLNDNIRQMAKILAMDGYVVVAVDLYDGQSATDSDTAQQLVGRVRENQAAATTKMRAAAQYLEEQENVTRLGVLGWCFGGGQALQLSLAEPMGATVIYYGTPLVNNTASLQRIGGPVLGIFGANDTSIPATTVLAFKNALEEAGIDNEIYIYPDVGHAFANPTGDNYAREETVDAWNKTILFLDRALNRETAISDDEEDNETNDDANTGNRPAASNGTNTTNTTRTTITTGRSQIVTGNDTGSDVTYDIEAENFRFIIDGDENPTIRVNQGDSVTINLESIGGLHDFMIDELDVQTEQIEDGESDTVTFTADEAGTFEYYCSVGQHRQMGMRGTIIVNES